MIFWMVFIVLHCDFTSNLIIYLFFAVLCGLHNLSTPIRERTPGSKIVEF